MVASEESSLNSISVTMTPRGASGLTWSVKGRVATRTGSPALAVSALVRSKNRVDKAKLTMVISILKRRFIIFVSGKKVGVRNKMVSRAATQALLMLRKIDSLEAVPKTLLKPEIKQRMERMEQMRR